MSRAAVVLAALLLTGCSTYKAPRVPDPVTPRTLWQVCWDADGNWQLPSDLPPHAPECGDSSVIRWPRGQVRLAIPYDAPYLDAHLDEAIAQWNKWLGWPMFVRTNVAYDVAVVGQPPHLYLAGIVGLKIEADVMVGAVLLFGYHPEYETKILLHELGHVLGLAHDADVKSLMHQGGVAVEVQVDDVVALRALYGR